MSHAAHNLHPEFWKPPEAAEAAPTPARPKTTPAGACPRCGSEFVIGARFCHVCGTARMSRGLSLKSLLSQVLDFHRIRETLGLAPGAAVALGLGIVCLIAALFTGFLFTATTLTDWQAVQVWRIEWLLAAAAAFLAGILLKR